MCIEGAIYTTGNNMVAFLNLAGMNVFTMLSEYHKIMS